RYIARSPSNSARHPAQPTNLDWRRRYTHCCRLRANPFSECMDLSAGPTINQLH
ncbi:hypothetical protein GGI08_007505, partial [Coemansia sp. S2]